MEARYQSNKQKAENKLLKIKNEKETYYKWLLFSFSIISLASILIMIFLYRIRKLKHHRNMSRVQESIYQKEIQIQISKNSLILKEAEQRETEQNLHMKNQEINQYILSQSITANKLNDLKESLKYFLLKLRTKKDREDLEFIIQNLSHANKNNLREFEKIFKSIYPTFFENLSKQFPQLSPKEHQLCAMLKLDLSSKQIADIVYISERSVETNRYRIRKKLGINTSVNLKTFLNAL